MLPRGGGFGIVDTTSSWTRERLEPAGRGYAVCRVPNLDPTSLRGPGSRMVLRNRAPTLTAAAHGNETTALSLLEQPFCSGVQGAKVTVLRVRSLRRIAKSSGPTVGGQRIDRTGDLVAAKYNKERAGADTGGLSARRVALGTLQEVTVRHHGACRQLSLGRRPFGHLSDPQKPAGCPSPPRTSFASRGVSRATRRIGACRPDHQTCAPQIFAQPSNRLAVNAPAPSTSGSGLCRYY